MEGRNVFDTVNDWIRDSEASFVNLLSAVAPWLAPLAPAYMSFRHMTGVMGFPEGIAWSIAAVVEVLGLSGVSTTLDFWTFNRRNDKDKQMRKAPVGIAAGSFLAYLSVILTMNVLLEIATLQGETAKAWAIILAKALLTLLSVPAAVLMAVRTSHRSLIHEVNLEKAEAKEERRRAAAERRADRLAMQQAPQGVQPVAETNGKQQKRRFLEDRQSGRLQQELDARGLSLNAAALVEIYGTSERNAWRWLAEVQKTNGNGA